MRTSIHRLYRIMLWYKLFNGLCKSSDRLWTRYEYHRIFHHNLTGKFSCNLLDCPCNLNCLNGCNGCPNPICVCGENMTRQNEDNFKECMQEKSIDLGRCIVDCKDDQLCEQSCVDLFKSRYDECPCQVSRRGEILLRSRRLDCTVMMYRYNCV